jgi:hypothetical protein
MECHLGSFGAPNEVRDALFRELSEWSFWLDVESQTMGDPEAMHEMHLFDRDAYDEWVMEQDPERRLRAELAGQRNLVAAARSMVECQRLRLDLECARMRLEDRSA